MLRDWIEQAAAAHGDDIYLADARGTATLTYAELLELVRDTETRLDRAGLVPGARIGVRKLAEPAVRGRARGHRRRGPGRGSA